MVAWIKMKPFYYFLLREHFHLFGALDLYLVFLLQE